MHGDQAVATDHDDPMCARLLGTAADVLRSFGSAFGGRHLAIVGGAVPSLLVGGVPRRMRPHVGTADLDFHLSLHLLDGETADYYQAIIDGLRSLGLRTDVQGGREVKWRWVGRYRDARMLGYEFPVAGLASWLCLKADAIMRRDKPKDAYDVVWLIDALGPGEAAARIAASPLLDGELAPDVLGQLTRLAFDQFRNTDAADPEMYASFLGASGGDAERRHAHGTVTALGRELHVRGINL